MRTTLCRPRHHRRSRVRLFVLTLLVGTLLLVPKPAGAEPSGADSVRTVLILPGLEPDAIRRINAAERIRVGIDRTSREPRTIRERNTRGGLVKLRHPASEWSAGGDSLLVIRSDGALGPPPFRIRSVEVAEGKQLLRGMRVGTIGGFFVGFIGVPVVLWRFFDGRPETCEFCINLAPWFRGILYGTLSGAVVGSLIGGNTPVWKRVYEAPVPPQSAPEKQR